MSNVDVLDEVDAAIFSGDILFTNLKEVKEYLTRWEKAVKEHEETITENETV